MATPEQLAEINQLAEKHGGPFAWLAKEAMTTGNLDENSPLSGMTMLQIAIATSNLPAVKCLLEAGANPNAHTTSTRHPLVESIQLVDDITTEKGLDWNKRLRKIATAHGIFTLLLTHGADPEAKTQEKGHPLNRCVELGDFSMVFLLLEFKANPNRFNKETGGTPLHRSIWAKNTEASMALLKFGADPEIKNAFGKNALVLARAAKLDNVARRAQEIIARKTLKQPDLEM